MKRTSRLASFLISLSVALASFPSAALAQVFRPVAPVAPGSAAGVRAIAPVAGVSAALSPAASLTTGLGAASLAAANAAPVVLAAAAAAPAAPLAVPAVLAAAAPAANASSNFRTPGPAATGVANEAAAYAADEDGAPAAAASTARPAAARAEAAPRAATRGFVLRLTDVIMGRASLSSLFDAAGGREKSAPVYGRLGLREHKPIFLPNGTRPDQEPSIPSPDREPTVLVQNYALPGSKDVGGILDAAKRVLNADPNDTDAVVAAVKAMIDSDKARFGVSSADLKLVHARKFEGTGPIADSIFINFRQTKAGLLVHGSNLSFTLKVLDGKPTIVAQTGQIFPALDVNTTAAMTDEQIRAKIAERTGMTPEDVAGGLAYVDQKIIYSHGAWRNVKLYVSPLMPFMIAVDLDSGLVFAWDNRAGLKSSKKDSAAGASASGKTVTKGPILPDSKITEIPLSFLSITIGGKTYVTDKNGGIPAEGLDIPAEGVAVKATLAGPYVTVQDTSGKTLEINATLKPVDGVIKVVFNPDAANTADGENALAQVNAFHKVNFAYNFLKERKLTTDRMDKEPIVVKTNVDDECNAYYTPGSPSLNFFKSSVNCVNSAYDTVADHEYGHYWDDMTGGITNGGLSEGWGDTVSMYSLDNPVIGEHFLKKPGPDGRDYIRVGDERNTYKYNEYDEVHAQSQAFTRPVWMFRAFLMKELGPAAGAALAEAIVLPAMFAKAASIPDALAQILVNAMKKDGTIAYETEFRKLVSESGITLPNGKGLVAGLVERFTAPLKQVKTTAIHAPQSPREVATAFDALAARLAAENGGARRTIRFTAGALLRKRVANEIRKYLDEAGAKYELHEYKGWTSSDFLLVIEGPNADSLAADVSRWLSRVAKDN